MDQPLLVLWDCFAGGSLLRSVRSLLMLSLKHSEGQGDTSFTWLTFNFQVSLGSLSCCGSHPVWCFLPSSREVFWVGLAATWAQSMVYPLPCFTVGKVVFLFLSKSSSRYSSVHGACFLHCISLFVLKKQEDDWKMCGSKTMALIGLSVLRTVLKMFLIF